MTTPGLDRDPRPPSVTVALRSALPRRRQLGPHGRPMINIVVTIVVIHVWED